jgi:hypothetical protein
MLFALPSPRKTPFTLNEAISLSEQHFHHLSLFRYVENGTTLGITMLLFQASLFLTSSKDRYTHSGWQECESDHRNSLNVDKQINQFHLRNALHHTGDTQRMLSI